MQRRVNQANNNRQAVHGPKKTGKIFTLIGQQRLQGFGALFSQICHNHFLDVRQALLPGYWVEIEVWLDGLEFDPDYQLVTGVYIKNAAGLRQTFYVDQLSLVMLED